MYALKVRVFISKRYQKGVENFSDKGIEKMFNFFFLIKCLQIYLEILEINKKV